MAYRKIFSFSQIPLIWHIRAVLIKLWNSSAKIKNFKVLILNLTVKSIYSNLGKFLILYILSDLVQLNLLEKKQIQELKESFIEVIYLIFYWQLIKTHYLKKTFDLNENQDQDYNLYQGLFQLDSLVDNFFAGAKNSVNLNNQGFQILKQPLIPKLRLS